MKQNIVNREDILDIYVNGASRGNPGCKKIYLLACKSLLG